MARPTTPKIWANSGQAIINEPAQGYRQTGFPVSQPPADFLNWVLNNLYQWTDYFDTNIGGRGGLTITFMTARPRIQLPFSLPAGDNKLDSIDVFKRGESSLGGVSTSANSGTGTVSAPTTASAAITYGVDGRSARVGNRSFTVRPAGELSGNELPTASGGGYSFPEINLWTDRNWYSLRIQSASMNSSGTITSMSLESAESGIASDTYSSGTLASVGRTLMNNTWLIGAPSQSDIAAGRCKVWTFSSATRFSSGSNSVSGGLSSTVSPIYDNTPLSGIRYWVFASSYNNNSRAARGSETSGSITIAGVTYNVASYSYNPGTNAIHLTLTGSAAADAFHTFKIKSGTQDLITLLSANAAYSTPPDESTHRQFLWSNIASDPITSAGTYTFEFLSSGSGLPAYSFTRLTTGMAIETYGGSDYLYISAGVANNDVLFIRRKEAA